MAKNKTVLVLAIFAGTLIGGGFGFQFLEEQRHQYLDDAVEKFERRRAELEAEKAANQALLDQAASSSSTSNN
ncbi:hypothetical protein PTSG_12247 [Salpingoeca rosetta]|uniref:Uncharacterized protein n=1 Tax=Salpingoeca rosetta (strain ATCC 50818 / BSB-021) TaxID=946362 RepID=F2U9C6_SALR5|nr:uncharacterized protein PTSG_12247 [Salpingoeca rosetta]EGD73329.1 hypothetical protein PTSG_12247 [Salpingoeca rosetta]|eukprot:XP_004994359.1 hypothetical protein PTSG_12247 [Salpingoeca rosetta]